MCSSDLSCGKVLMPLTPKQSRFVAEYLIDQNATQAAIRAGYSKKTASSQGERLLRNVEIAAAVGVKQDQQLAKLEITAERVLQELARIAFVDVRAFYRDDGTLKQMTELEADAAAAIAQFDVLKQNVTSGDGQLDTVHRIRFVEKIRALELLAKRFGLVKEQVEVTGLNELVERLTRARARVTKADQ